MKLLSGNPSNMYNHIGEVLICLKEISPVIAYYSFLKKGEGVIYKHTYITCNCTVS